MTNRNILEGLQHLGVDIDVLLTEPRVLATPISFIQIFGGLDHARQESPTDRRIWDVRYPQLLAHSKYFVFGKPCPQGVLDLHGRHRIRRMRSAYRPWRGLGHTNVPDLPGCNEVGHRPDRFLDWHGRVHPMDVVQIDVIDTESCQAGVATVTNVLGI